MANEQHVRRLYQGVDAWNNWRIETTIEPDLSGADLRVANLRGAKLSRANLRDADLSGAKLERAKLERADLAGVDLSAADLRGADLFGASLKGAELFEANLSRANLSTADLSEAKLLGTNLSEANLRRASLSGAELNRADLSRTDLSRATLLLTRFNSVTLNDANLTEAILSGTVFSDTDLTHVIGLAESHHRGPSVIDHRTLEKSGPLPISFFHGIGLPDNLIDCLPSLFNKGLQCYSCFISYSVGDEEFAKHLYATLQTNGVRCWFAPHDLPIGEKILEGIDAAIGLRDKVLLILSDNSIQSDWIEDEVTAGFEEELKRGQFVFFPIRLDDAVFKTDEAWAAKLRARNIGDFRRWKDHEAYSASLDGVLRDLKARP